MLNVRKPLMTRPNQSLSHLGLSGYGRDFRRVIANSGLWSTSTTANGQTSVAVGGYI